MAQSEQAGISSEAKRAAEASINTLIGQMNNKKAALEAVKNEVQAEVRKGVAICPLGSCKELMAIADTFSRKVAESAPSISKEIDDQKKKVADQIGKRIATQDALIKEATTVADTKKKEFETAFVALKNSPTSEAAKTELIAKTSAMKAAGDALTQKVTTRNTEVSGFIERNANTFSAQPKLLDEAKVASVETMKKVQEAVKISSTVNLDNLNTMLAPPKLQDRPLSQQPVTTDFKSQLASFTQLSATTGLIQTIKPPTLPPRTENPPTGGLTPPTTPNPPTGTNPPSTTTPPRTDTPPTNPPKLRILADEYEVDGGVLVVPDEQAGSSMSMPGPADGAPQVNASLDIAATTQNVQVDTNFLSRMASFLAVMAFGLIAALF